MEPQKVIPSRLVLSIGDYQYVPKHLINDKIVGFITPNVCECVCGILSSDQGMGFFHFSKSSDPLDLAEKLKKDFLNATSLKITLIGGNLIPGFSPWKEKNRELKYKDQNNEFSGPEAMEHFRQCPRDFGTYSAEDLITVHDQCQKKELEGKNLLTYDYNLLNEKLAEKNYQAVDRRREFSFKICGVKDFVGFQILAKVINVLTDNPDIFKGDNIQHFNSPWGDDVTADFNGDFNSLPNGSFMGVTGEFKIIKNIEGLPVQKIASGFKYLENKSIKNKVAIGVI